LGSVEPAPVLILISLHNGQSTHQRFAPHFLAFARVMVLSGTGFMARFRSDAFQFVCAAF
jgi:hypothetical protein